MTEEAKRGLNGLGFIPIYCHPELAEGLLFDAIKNVPKELGHFLFPLPSVPNLRDRL